MPFYNLFKKRRKEARFTFAVRKKSFRESELQSSFEILKEWVLFNGRFCD